MDKIERLTTIVDLGLADDEEILYHNPNDSQGAYTILDLAKYSEDGDGTESEILLKISRRLAELENKMENGLLVELPCKLGDTVYFVKSAFSFAAFPIDSKVVSIRGINCDYEVMYSAITNYNKLDRTFTSADIGKTVFLEKEQAEQKLSELKILSNQ